MCSQKVNCQPEYQLSSASAVDKSATRWGRHVRAGKFGRGRVLDQGPRAAGGQAPSLGTCQHSASTKMQEKLGLQYAARKVGVGPTCGPIIRLMLKADRLRSDGSVIVVRSDVVGLRGGRQRTISEHTPEVFCLLSLLGA
jgi:hypothetical protein